MNIKPADAVRISIPMLDQLMSEKQAELSQAQTNAARCQTELQSLQLMRAGASALMNDDDKRTEQAQQQGPPNGEA